MTNVPHKKLGRLLSFILRHKPDAIGLTLHPMGWVDVDALIDGINTHTNINITRSDLKEVVLADSKQRFSFNPSYDLIKANQGHSADVELKFEKRKPPTVLYHGTNITALLAMKKSGKIERMQRHHVHLSTDVTTALEVARRRKTGGEIVIRVFARKMEENGYEFFISDNNVWLVNEVPLEYTDLTV